MKLNPLLMFLLALILAPMLGVARCFRPEGVDAINVQGTFDETITRTADGAIPAHSIVTDGTTPGTQVKVCTAATIPVGTAYDTAIDTAKVGVELLAGASSRLVIASKAIAAGVRVYATAAGQVTDAVVSNAYMVGHSLTAAVSAGDEFLIMPLVAAVKNP